MIKAVLFDLDGTLINTLDDLADATNHALQKNGFPVHPVESYKYMVGNGIPKLIERAVPEENRTPETLETVKKDFFEFYDVHGLDKTKPYEGTAELVNALKSKGYKIAVVTNKYEPAAIKIINDLFGNVFDAVVGQLEGRPTKPDPTAAHIAMEKLGVKENECVFMGDSGVDIQTAVNSGAVPVGVLWGFRDEKELTDNGAKIIIKSPAALLKVVDELNSKNDTYMDLGLSIGLMVGTLIMLISSLFGHIEYGGISVPLCFLIGMVIGLSIKKKKN